MIIPDSHWTLKNLLKKTCKSFLILSIFISVNACVSTSLKAPAIPGQVRKLAPDNTKSISLQLNKFQPPESLGHQYLLILLPFGNIIFPGIQDAVINAAFTELTLAGYKPITASFSPPRYTQLVLTIKNIQLTAYDLLIIRKIVCHLDLEASLIGQDGVVKRATETNAYAAEYKALAFEKNLQHTFDICLQSAITDLISKLGLKQ